MKKYFLYSILVISTNTFSNEKIEFEIVKSVDGESNSVFIDKNPVQLTKEETEELYKEVNSIIIDKNIKYNLIFNDLIIYVHPENGYNKTKILIPYKTIDNRISQSPKGLDTLIINCPVIETTTEHKVVYHDENGHKRFVAMHFEPNDKVLEEKVIFQGYYKNSKNIEEKPLYKQNNIIAAKAHLICNMIGVFGAQRAVYSERKKIYEKMLTE
ncbi:MULTISPECIES: hypothetical protein [unclassified Acinetobacter]|uniref:hypothetical protein n=1 Tax=unclassified Acinetobacter TaxID=196816 RepID=UPI002447DD62|nr:MULTISPECIES: hypothetical protein [unclassified Acinetobacter]MDH0029680.1 hypothetical protein [Acinetobacter sp. GD04021]MDH0887905.1 hypothetical protein [Acinetobacter sp. GD03873]MDH1081674.1 hypothetical protein [Acinetobacter sp. GD03983]MDH2191237.1 hypothetical protein [Acinetobacter sp. GD03645]MDH2204699.1 hypothetical protein [Acinetobacter sp. GD03647]